MYLTPSLELDVFRQLSLPQINSVTLAVFMGVGGSSWIEVARSEGSQSNVIKCNKESRWIRLPESVSKITKKTMPWVSTFSFFFLLLHITNRLSAQDEERRRVGLMSE